MRHEVLKADGNQHGNSNLARARTWSTAVSRTGGEECLQADGGVDGTIWPCGTAPIVGSES
eukprot:5776640-Heterocapsa_arctica.AAC.1